MKICFVTHQHPPNVSTGLGRYSMNLTQLLEKQGHKVTVITHDKRGGKKYEKKGNIEVYRLHIPKSRLLDKVLPNLLDERILFESRLKSFFKRFDLRSYDVLHILDMRDSMFLNKKISKQIPTFITANDYYPFEASWNMFRFPYFCLDLPLRYLNYMYYKFFLPRHMMFATIIIANSNYTARTINRYTNIPKHKLKVIYKGINIKTFSEKGGWDDKKKYNSHNIIYIGSNMERKGVDYLLKALPRVIKRFPDTKLTMIGRKSWLFKKQMEKIVKRWKLDKHIEENWYVPGEKISGFLKNSNVFVMPSIIEALGQVYMEAMCMKTPVIGTNVGGVPEVIDDKTDEKCGFLVRPRNAKEIGDAIIKVFENPELAKKMGKNGKNIVLRKFSMDTMFADTIDLYKDILEKRKHKH